MIWQNAAIYKTSNGSNEVVLRFVGGRNPKWLNIELDSAKAEKVKIQIWLLHDKKTRNDLIRNAAAEMCEHLGLSCAELSSVARDIRKFAEQLL